MEKKRRRPKKRGFTDKLYFTNLIFAWVYTATCVVLSCFGQTIGIDNYDFVSSVIPYVWGELGVHTGFIIWKAKSENISKYGNPENISM